METDVEKGCCEGTLMPDGMLRLDLESHLDHYVLPWELDRFRANPDSLEHILADSQ